jgi:hypothetical protein
MVLYHGSPHKLKGDKLIPKPAEDLEKNKHNTITGIYASGFKNAAIAMAVLSTKGVWHAGLDTAAKNPIGIIYRGWPKQRYIYLHYLPSRTFKNIPKNSAQWVSEKPIKPLRTERLNVKDYIHFVRKATKKERDSWKKKYGK